MFTADLLQSAPAPHQNKTQKHKQKQKQKQKQKGRGRSRGTGARNGKGRAAYADSGSDSDSDSNSNSGEDSDGTQIAGRVGMGTGGGSSTTASALLSQPQTVDEVGAQDAFVAGMIYALSRRLVPGEPYTPSAVAREGAGGITVHGAEDNDRGKWRLEECLRCVCP